MEGVAVGVQHLPFNHRGGAVNRVLHADQLKGAILAPGPQLLQTCADAVILVGNLLEGKAAAALASLRFQLLSAARGRLRGRLFGLP